MPYKVGQLIKYENEYYVIQDLYYSMGTDYCDLYSMNGEQHNKFAIPENEFKKFELIDIKVGDKVKILKNNKDFLDVKYIESMQKYEDKILSISSIIRYYSGCQIAYKLDNIDYIFTSAWFVVINKESNNILLNKIYNNLGK